MEKKIYHKKENMTDAIDTALYGYDVESIPEIARRFGIQAMTLYRWVSERAKELTCHHPRSEECRALCCRGKSHYCGALHDTDFGDRECPFFTTKRGFMNRFIASNRKSDDDLLAMKDSGYEVDDILDSYGLTDDYEDGFDVFPEGF